jgi:hypothetical protein
LAWFVTANPDVPAPDILKGRGSLEGAGRSRVAKPEVSEVGRLFIDDARGFALTLSRVRFAGRSPLQRRVKEYQL